MDITRGERHGVPFYFCAHPAWAQVPHGFSTRLGGVSPAPWDSLNLGAARGDDAARVQENYRRFCAAIGANPNALVKNHQIHSRLVRRVTWADVMDNPATPGEFHADALITDQPGLCLSVFSGDCIPILLYDPKRRVVAAVHAGWRGTALGVAASAVERMAADYGCRAENILAAVGPGISACCFQTHADVPHALRDGLGLAAEPFIKDLPGAEKYCVDLKRANARWLTLRGVKAEHIAISAACTACNLDEFWSHRVQGDRRGSMAAMIQLPGGAPI
jgi:YfiH family protein